MSALRSQFYEAGFGILLKQHPFVIPEFSEDIHHESKLSSK
jgi:hypothetical protein